MRSARDHGLLPESVDKRWTPLPTAVLRGNAVSCRVRPQSHSRQPGKVK